jgi:hypothetical protein
MLTIKCTYTHNAVDDDGNLGRNYSLDLQWMAAKDWSLSKMANKHVEYLYHELSGLETI